jgi:hypothetical protein
MEVDHIGLESCQTWAEFCLATRLLVQWGSGEPGPVGGDVVAAEYYTPLIVTRCQSEVAGDVQNQFRWVRSERVY